MAFQDIIEFETGGRGTEDITARVNAALEHAGIETGICQLFILHTSASLLLTENADPDVRGDIETVLADLAPDGDARFRHRDEGPDDMSAHIRTMLTESSLVVPVAAGRLKLGTWQGVFLYEHRAAPHRRRIVVTVLG
ncbi:MAG: secondary thiamine-phosphate synthase enzyme YjbQ [Gammaproteobacteria bacterium]|nr:secondary thiamine-phosphate synthase enzyme YjbQ [Gammaproteobacteria bacterium]